MSGGTSNGGGAAALPKKKNPYQCFTSSKMSEWKEKNPGEKMAVTKIMTAAGAEWKSLTDEEKQPYVKQAEEEKERYDREVEAFGGLDALNDAKTGQRSLRTKKDTRSEKDPNKPKRPLSAYFHFMAAKRVEVKSEHSDGKPTEIMTLLGAMWKKSTDEEKQPYHDLAKEGRERYDKEMVEYSGQGTN